MIIYSKTNHSRRDNYQLKTSIESIGDSLFVFKEAHTEKAEDFLLTFFDKYNILKVGQFFLKPLKPVLVEEGGKKRVRFSYKKQALLESVLIDYVNSGDEVGFNRVLKEYIGKIKKSIEKKSKLTGEFISIFGEDINSYECIGVGCIDLNFDNILIDKDSSRYLLFDYEWTFDFPVPYKYVLFRSIMYFYVKHINDFSQEKFCIDKIFGLAEITNKEIETFLKFEYNFQNFVNKEHEKRVDFKSYRKKFFDLYENKHDFSGHMFIEQKSRLEEQLKQKIKESDLCIQQKKDEISQLKQVIKEKEKEVIIARQATEQVCQEVNFVKSSKFWRLRGVYIRSKERVKFAFLNPKAFLLKYRGKIGRLKREAFNSYKREGLRRVLQRIANYIFLGKGILSGTSVGPAQIKPDFTHLSQRERVGLDFINKEHFLKLGVVPYYLDPINQHKIKREALIAVHLHLFHVDMMEECITYFQNIPLPFDLFVSVSKGSDVGSIRKKIKSEIKNVGKVFVEEVPNRGRDIAPLIVQFGKRLLKYEIISHIHTKKSTHWDKFKGWFPSIMDTLYGTESKVSQIISLLIEDGKIVYPEGNLNIVLDDSGWSENLAIAKEVLNKYTNLSIDKFSFVEFSQGSMFWAKSECLREFLSLPLKYSDFPKEPIPEDGTLAHALERLLLVFASSYNGKCYRIHRKDSIDNYRFYEEQKDYSEKLQHKTVKVLSYYLPQFHPIPENNKWHGEGFTEWHKVKCSNPLFCGHYQQHIPHEDIGYYLLDSPKILRKQAEMMKKAGVYGQIFYHYWFGGKLILENPAKMLFDNKDIAMPFCFCWANENWTKCWDGNEQDVLIGQKYSKQDAIEFIKYLIPFFRDERYIKVEKRPVLFVYRPSSIPNFSSYLEAWQKECLNSGIESPYIVATLTRGATSPDEYGVDAGAERVLHDWTDGNVPDIKNELHQYKQMKGGVLGYKEVADYYMKKVESEKEPFTHFRSLVPIWDNTARYGESASLLHGADTCKFQEWITTLIKDAELNLPEDRRFVIVNAWNEWAEGAHLEPDTRFGYGYLNSVGRALSKISFEEKFCFQDNLNNGELDLKKVFIKLDFSSEALNFLRRNKLSRDKFIRCLARSTIFDFCNIVICNMEIKKYLEELSLDVKYFFREEDSLDFTILFGSVGCFSGDALLKMVEMGIFTKTSVICANCMNGSQTNPLDVSDNGSINSFNATEVRLYPNVKGDYKNYRICCDAVYVNFINDDLPIKDLPTVTTVIRFHKDGDLKLLNNALLSLLSQSNCIVQPMITVQTLASDQMNSLKRLVYQYPWNERYKPIIKKFVPDKKSPDLRSRMLNKGFLEAKTRYLAVLDYDDMVFPFAYEWFIDRLKKTDKAVSFGRVFVSIFDGKKMQVIERRKVYKNGSDYEEFLENNHAPLHSFFIDLRGVDLTRVKYFDDMKYLEDYYLTLQIFKKNNVDWESLKVNKYVGDYMHNIDNKNTLAVLEDEKKKSVLRGAVYLNCEKRVSDLKVEIKAKKLT